MFQVVPLLGNIKWQACVCHTSIADVNVKVNNILTLEFVKRQTDVFMCLGGGWGRGVGT
jgi:hypothetical protein